MFNVLVKTNNLTFCLPYSQIKYNMCLYRRKKILRHQRGNQYPYIEEGYTIQLPEELYKDTNIDL